MNDLIQHILNKNFDAAREALDESMEDIIERRLTEMRRAIDISEGWYKKTLDSASKKSDKEGNWDFKKGDYSEKGRKELTTGEKIVDKADNAKIAIGKKLRHALSEGRHKGIGNKKKKGRLAQQTQDLRKTFGVAPGKTRRAGPRASLEEDIQGFIQAARAAGKDVKNQYNKDIAPGMKAAGKVVGDAARKVGKKIGDWNDKNPNFGMTKSYSNKKMNEGYYKEKDIERQENEPPFKPDDPKAEKHSSASLARRAMKAAKKAKEKKLDEESAKERHSASEKFWANQEKKDKGKLAKSVLKGAKKAGINIKSKQKLDEVAKWRKNANLYTKKTDPDNYADSQSYDYHDENPKSTGMKKSTADTPTKWGSINDRKPGRLRKDGKPLARTISGLKARIKANLGKE